MVAPRPTAAASLTLTPIPDRWVAVLMFHQVSSNPVESAAGVDHITKPWLSPAQFDHVLTDLAANGYHVISLAQALDIVQGRDVALPSKPVLITFDDGYRSAWTEATPILARHHDVATMFFEGHATDNPLIPRRLTRADVRAMARSGIWSVQSHGFAGHSDLLVSANGATSPYWYANLAWLPKLHRFETRTEFQKRITADLTHFRTTFEPFTGAPIDVFAFPSGEYGQNAPLRPGETASIRIQAGDSNAADLTPLVDTALRSAGYIAAFAVSNYGSDHLANATDSIFAIPRIGVNESFTLAEISALETVGSELPEIAQGKYADVGPVAVIPGGMLAASTDAPTLFVLNAEGRAQGTSSFPELLMDRAGHRSLIRGLAFDHGTLWLIQQKGQGPHARPMLAQFTVLPGKIAFVSRKPLPAAMNWTVGLAVIDHRLVAIDGSGDLFDATSGTAITKLSGVAPGDPGIDPYSRFTGLAATATTLFTYDRATK
ncbi:MAG: polysaccharide deacetylase family protein, partial [Vulcanimicrobiaceae bacterium]